MDKSSTITLHTGQEMPVMGLGTWQLTKDTADTVAKALELGYRLIDTSGDYGTQPGIGQGIRQSGAGREAFYLVTKVEETDDAYQAVRTNLRELDLDFANLILIHRPPKSGAGQALWDGLRKARDEGLARDIGVSNYPTHLIEELIADSGETPAVNQIEWSPFGHSQEMVEFCVAHNIVIQAYSPLTRTQRLDDPTLDRIAANHHKTPAQVLIRWNLQHGTVPIPKANQLEHLTQDIDVFDFDLSDTDMATLDGLNEQFSALGRLPYV